MALRCRLGWHSWISSPIQGGIYSQRYGEHAWTRQICQRCNLVEEWYTGFDKKRHLYHSCYLPVAKLLQ